MLKKNLNLSTIVFCDIVRSTELSYKLGSIFGNIIKNFFIISSEYHKKYKGLFFQTTGDGFLTTFDIPKNAIMFISDLLKSKIFGNNDIKIRISLHIAKLSLTKSPYGDYLNGEGLSFAAKLNHLAGPNEVVASDIVYHILSDDFKPNFVQKKHGILKYDKKIVFWIFNPYMNKKLYNEK